MGTSSRRNFLRSAGLFSGALTLGSGLLPQKAAAYTGSYGLPYYKPGAPLAMDLRQGNGQAFTLRGVVYQHDGRTPLPGATVEIWHCNEQGRFDFSNRYQFRGKAVTDQHGTYHFKTNFPGRYRESGAAKMSRIFVLVRGAAHKEFFSQLYFDRQKRPYIDHRHWDACAMAQKPTMPKRTDTITGGVVVTHNHYLQAGSLFSLSSGKEAAARQIQVYPSGEKQSSMTFGNVHPGPVSVQLSDKYGRVVQRSFFKTARPEQPVLLHGESLPPGVYTCSIYTGRLGWFVKRLAIG